MQVRGDTVSDTRYGRSMTDRTPTAIDAIAEAHHEQSIALSPIAATYLGVPAATASSTTSPRLGGRRWPTWRVAPSLRWLAPRPSTTSTGSP